MKLDVLEEKENAVLQRRELTVKINYEGGPTPSCRAVGEELAKSLGAAAELVEIKKLVGATGETCGHAKVHVWASVEAREKIKPKKRAKAGKKAAEGGKKA